MTLSRGVVREEHVASVLNVDRELLSVVANYSTCNLDTHTVTYNLGAIEATIGHKFFRNMPLISMRVSCTWFWLRTYFTEETQKLSKFSF